MSTTFIYALAEPNDNTVIRYIGKSNDPNERFRNHIRDSKKERTYKASWIKKLLRNGEIPELVILDEVDENEWEFWETYYYNLYKSWGFKLTNTALCGKGGKNRNCFTQEQKEKLRQISLERSLRGKDHPGYGKKRSLETIEKQKKTRLIRGTKTKSRVKIEQYNYETNKLIKVFNCIKDCSEELNIGVNKIQEVMQGYRAAGKGVRKTVYSYKGFTFKKQYEREED